MRIRPLFILPVVCLVFFSSCRDPKIRSYRIAKEAPPPTAPTDMASMSGMTAPVAAAAAPGIHWQKPEAWQEQPGKSMRIGSFLIPGSDGRKAEVAVTTFPGDVGGDFANVNRWRGQIQLPPIAEAELASAITSVDLPAGKFQILDITSAEPLIDGKYNARILGAWLKQPERTWFFKLMGDDESVGDERGSVLPGRTTEARCVPGGADLLRRRAANGFGSRAGYGWNEALKRREDAENRSGR